ncbi:MAG: EAL domain-containing protein [Gammaproteobacteria bacterium]
MRTFSKEHGRKPWLAELFHSIRTWQIGVIMALVLSAFTWLQVQSYRAIESELTNNALAERSAIAQLAAATLSEKFNRVIDLGASLATRVQFRELIAAERWPDAGEILRSVPDDFPYIERLFLTDPAGTLMVDVPALEGGVRGTNFAYRDWYQGVSNQWQPHISGVYQRTAIPQRNVFAVTIPVRNADAQILGILVLQLDMEGFFAWVSEIDFGPEGFIYIVDNKQQLAYHPDYPAQGEIVDYSHVPIVGKVMQQQQGVEIIFDTGTDAEQVTAYIPIAQGWGVIAQQPARVAFASRDWQLASILTGYFLVLLFTLVIVVLAALLFYQRQQVDHDRRIREEIERQWAFFRKVIDLDRNMIFVKDRDGRFVLVNEATARIFGMTVDDLLGKTNSDVIKDPNAVKRFYQDEQEILETLQEKFFPEVMIKDINGNVRWLQTLMRPMTSTDGKADMVLSVATDITERKQMEDDLRENIERFEIISRATNDAIWDLDLLTDKIWWNQSFYSLFGYPYDSVEPDLEFWADQVHPDDRQRVTGSLQEAISGTDVYWSETYRFQRNDGSYAYVLGRGYIIRDGTDKTTRMIGSLADITGQHEQEIKIARLDRIRAVLSGINYTIVRVRDPDTLCQEACRIAVEHGGFVMAWIGLLDTATQEIRPVAWQGAEQGYLDVARFSARADLPEGQNLVSHALRENKPVVGDDIETTPGIKYRREMLERGFRSFAILPIAVGDKAIGTFTLYSQDIGAFDEDEMKLLREMAADVSYALDHIEKETRLNYLAYYDVLTGLPNLDLFNDRLTQALRSIKHNHILGLILIDIERFTYINDTFGRHAGDSILKQVATNLKSALPESDHVARVTANTFAVLLASMSSVAKVARFIEEKIIPGLTVPVVIDEQQLKISAKMGIVIYPGDGHDAETLFKNAEAALKSAKQQGDKYLFYTSEMNALIAEKLILENKLSQALENDEFVLFYQPKINIADNSICGMEALIRWNSETGMVPPDKFIPVLEETGLILDVGQWVIRRAMLDYQGWLDKGLEPPPIAVNISPIQLRQKDFAARINAILDAASCDAAMLELEITETVLMENLDDNIKKLGQLRERGLGISIDDFGTGYSSLRYMSKLPVTALKIDRAFITNLSTSAEDMAIVSAIIPLAHAMGLGVIAEGVETAEQLELLKQLNCNEYQGYLFSRPLSFDDMEVMLKNRSS